MTALTASSPAPVLGTTDVAPALPGGHYSMAGVLRSEWTKLRSVRSTTWSLAATIVLTIGIGVLATLMPALRWHNLDPGFRLTFDPVRQSLTGLLFGQLALGVLGVLVVSAEYGTGTIRATLTAVPRRPVVLAGKVLVFGAVALVASELLMFATFFIGQAILASSPAPHATLGQPGVLRAVVGGGFYLTILAMLAMGLAAIIRHTAGAISAFVTILLIVPLILQALPSSVVNTVGRYVPANIGATVTSTSGVAGFEGHHSFSPWAGLAVLAVYAVVALAVGGWLMVRRDA
jgi:ABC-type transport system involved in multi-copper enzyme maturation permease subunit